MKIILADGENLTVRTKTGKKSILLMCRGSWIGIRKIQKIQKNEN